MAEKITAIEEVEDIRLEYGTGGGYRVTTSAQTVEMGISMSQDCCESFGYFLSVDDPQEFVGAEFLGVEIVDAALVKTQLVEHVGEYGVDEGDVMFVNILTDRGVLQFTAYNSHNGYYSHSAVVRSEKVNLETAL